MCSQTVLCPKTTCKKQSPEPWRRVRRISPFYCGTCNGSPGFPSMTKAWNRRPFPRQFPRVWKQNTVNLRSGRVEHTAAVIGVEEEGRRGPSHRSQRCHCCTKPKTPATLLLVGDKRGGTKRPPFLFLFLFSFFLFFSHKTRTTFPLDALKFGPAFPTSFSSSGALYLLPSNAQVRPSLLLSNFSQKWRTMLQKRCYKSPSI
jgi:hypothetical protein